MRLSRTRKCALVAAAVTAATALTAAPARAAADTTPPTQPGPIEIADITETTIRLTWAASTDDVGVTSYEVGQAYTDYVILHRTSTNEITLTGLRPSGTYRFYVVAFDAAGNRSTTVSTGPVTMPPGDDQPPTAPGTPVATQIGDTWMQLSWQGSTDNVYVAAYTVHLIEGDVITRIGTVPQHPPLGTTFRVTRLEPDTSYTFVVRALDDAGNMSLYSTPATFRTRPADAEPPSTPGTPRATEVTPTSVRLSWDLSTDDNWVANYVVVDLAAPGGAAELRTTTYNEVTLTVEPDTRYEFAVYAVDAVGNRSGLSGSLVLTTPAPVACAVTYQVAAQWHGAFQANVVLRNTGDETIEGWAMTWTFPSGQHIQQIWGAVADDRTGPDVAVHHQSWNGRVAPGAEAWFGFQGSWTGENQAPNAFRVNGIPCQVG